MPPTQPLILAGLVVLAVLRSAACSSPPPPVPPENRVIVRVMSAGEPVTGADVGCNLGAQTGVTGSDGTAVLPWPLEAPCELQVSAVGFQPFRGIVSFAPDGHYTAGLVRPPAVAGAVRVEGRSFADDRGQVNALGASLFWSLWGEASDPERLEANLRALADQDVDFVRILGMVGTATWADRRIDPRVPEYWPTVDKLLDRLGRLGLRAEVTLLADAQADPGAGWAGLPRAERMAYVEAWAERAVRRPELFQFFEVANEHWQNGVQDLGELRAYGERLRTLTSVPVALSAPTEGDVAAMYRGWPGIATMHYDRDTGRADGFYRPVRQPWGWPGEYFPNGGEPGLVVNNEPIGPDSSVASDGDPARIALGYVTTFVAGNGAYVYHSGAGIRGGGQNDRDRGRRPNVFDYDPAFLNALGFWRRRLPGGLANWERRNSQWQQPLPEFPWAGFNTADDRGDLVQAYATSDGRDVWAVVLGVRRAFTVTARWALDQELLDPVTGEVLEAVQLEPGATWTVPAIRPGYVVHGVRR